MNRRNIIIHVVPLSAFDATPGLPLNGKLDHLLRSGLRQQPGPALILQAFSRPPMPAYEPPNIAPMPNSFGTVSSNP